MGAGRSLSETFAEHFERTRFEALPASAVAAAKRCMLDTLAVAWPGTLAEGVPPLRGLLPAAATGEATLWAVGARATALDCAFLNGAAAAALDYDSLQDKAVVHSEVVLLPALLAAAERERADGRRLLRALVLATDVHCRLALSTLEYKGWFYTSMHGVFAAAAGCASIFGLGASGIRDAFGIALSQAGGTLQPMVEKSLTKRLQSAFAARAGLFSGLLAKAGVSAPREPFEGEYGLHALYAGGDVAVALAGLGERYLGEDMSLKKFPSCGCNHAVIEAVLQLAAEHDLKAADVALARTRISTFMHRLVGAPYDPRENPQVAAQFSVQYSVACALARRRLGLAEIEPASALDPALGELASRVEVVVDDHRAGKLAPAEVELVMRNGTRLVRRIEHLPGSPESPMSTADIDAKLRDCMSRGARPLAPEAIGRLAERVGRLEELDDVSRLFAGIVD